MILIANRQCGNWLINRGNMDTSKKLKSAIIDSHLKGDFAAVYDLIPQYAQHIFERINANDRTDDLLTDVKGFFADDSVAPSEKFDLLANWMIKLKGFEIIDKINIGNLVKPYLGDYAIRLAMELMSGRYFSDVSVEKFGESRRPNYGDAGVRLSDEDIIIRAITRNQPFDSYAMFIMSKRKGDQSLYSSNYINFSACKDSPVALQYFLEKDSKLDSKGRFGVKVSDAFVAAILADEGNVRSAEILDILVRHGFDVETFRYGDNYKDNAKIARERENSEMTDEILDFIDRYGLDVETQRFSDNYLHDVKNVSTMQWLVDHGQKIDDELLFSAISRGYYGIAKFILNEHFDKIDIKATDNGGNTFLHKTLRVVKPDFGSSDKTVFFDPNFEVFSLLINKGADYDARNADNVKVREALEYSAGHSEGATKCLAYLKSFHENKALNSLVDNGDEMDDDMANSL